MKLFTSDWLRKIILLLILLQNLNPQCVMCLFWSRVYFSVFVGLDVCQVHVGDVWISPDNNVLTPATSTYLQHVQLIVKTPSELRFHLTEIREHKIYIMHMNTACLKVNRVFTRLFLVCCKFAIILYRTLRVGCRIIVAFLKVFKQQIRSSLW